MAKGTASQIPHEHRTTDRLADSAHSAVDSAAEYSGRAEEQLREQGDRAAQQFRAGQERVSTKGRELNDDLLRYVHENPYTSLGLAIAGGYILGAILRRRG